MIELIHSDCMDYMREQPDKAFDLAIVDPPYGIEILSKKQNRGENTKYRRSMVAMAQSSERWNNKKPTKTYFEQLFRISNEQIIWGANNFELPPTEYFIVWNKKQTIPNFASAEYAWFSGNKMKMPAKVFEYSIHTANAEQKKIHPTQKPVKLYQWLLQNYAQPGQRILDTHLGSGSSAIAAHYFGCDFVGIELDKDYFEAAKKRIDRETRQQSLL